MIDARRLRILRAVADHRTVTAAAAALYLTPSAVSQQLAALEQETGHRLVERSARGARLTAAGEILLSHANVVLAQLERAEAFFQLADDSAGVAGTVTVAAFATGIGLVLAPALTELARTAPGIRVKVQDAEGRRWRCGRRGWRGREHCSRSRAPLPLLSTAPAPEHRPRP
ncbi:HTH-type transcriptional regulator HdfR [Streptomyces microflavus]